MPMFDEKLNFKEWQSDIELRTQRCALLDEHSCEPRLTATSSMYRLLCAFAHTSNHGRLLASNKRRRHLRLLGTTNLSAGSALTFMIGLKSCPDHTHLTFHRLARSLQRF